MLYASLATGQMEEDTWAHDSPTKTGSPAHRGIGIRNIDYTEIDQIHDLTIDCGLKTVRNVSHHFLSKMDWLLADGRIEFDRAVNRIRGRLSATHHFHQRNHVRRIKRMPDDAALGMLAGGLHHTHGEARGTRCNDGIRWRCSVHVSEQLNLEIFPL